MSARGEQQQVSGAHLRARLTARPDSTPRATAPPSGEHPVALGRKRDGLLYVPAAYDPARPAPLVVLLHGAGGDAAGVLPLLRPAADRHGLLVLVPESRRESWDVLRGGYGPDVAFIDTALGAAFERFAVAPAHLVVGGFSDGASYALSLGVANGDLFTHVVAFSPGFMAAPTQTGAPGIFVSHGTRDTVLPIDRCSRLLVPTLEQAGYDVRYTEFDGGHQVPREIVDDAVTWLLA
jgi:predicted esterase